jgi:membrane associated rhomboid family serine protease
MGIFNYYPEDISGRNKDLDKKIFRHSLYFAAFFILLFWLVKITEDIFGFDFYRAGIFPRHITGLPGIITSPFIHSTYNHLISNSVPFFILLFALVYFYRNLSYRIFFFIYILSGMCVWLMGRESWHIGASGIVYGLAAFHLVSGIIRNDLRLLIIATIVVFLYGGMIWGIFPFKPEISWESHRKKFEWEEESETGEDAEAPEDSTLPPSFGDPDSTFFDPDNNAGTNQSS